MCKPASKQATNKRLAQTNHEQAAIRFEMNNHKAENERQISIFPHFLSYRINFVHIIICDGEMNREEMWSCVFVCVCMCMLNAFGFSDALHWQITIYKYYGRDSGNDASG